MQFQTELALSRFGLGAAPGEIDRASGDPIAYLLDGLKDPDPLPGRKLYSSSHVIKQFLTYRRSRDARRKKAGGKVKRMSQNPAITAYRAELRSRLKAFSDSQTPFVERLAMFWADHFTVSARSPRIAGIAGSFEREAIRANMGGNFADMLLAVAKHPAMLLYLNNAESIGPNSRVGKRRNRGLNENLARELLELHTLGVDGGYSLDDIQELAKAITGWSVAGPKAKKYQTGKFYFRLRAHEPGSRTLLGHTYEASRSAKTGERVLHDMAHHPATARFIARKLATYFVSDTPSQALVDALETAFIKNHGELMPVYEALLNHPDAWLVEPGKFKTPIDFVASTIRGLSDNKHGKFWIDGLQTNGQKYWAPPSPAGWPNDTATWATSDGLKTRLDFAVTIAAGAANLYDPPELARQMLGNALHRETALAISRAANRKQGIALLLMSPEFQRR